MTRGKLVMVKDDGIYSSCEFNGDMYIEGNGRDAYKLLESVDEKTVFFKDVVERFNKEHYGYGRDEYGDLSSKISDKIDPYLLDMSVDYIGKWFSDYLYMKNLSSDVVEWVDKDGGVHKLKPGMIAVVYFGEQAYTDVQLDRFVHNGEELAEESYMYEMEPDSGEIQKLKLEDLTLKELDEVEKSVGMDNIAAIYNSVYDVGAEQVLMINGLPDWMRSDVYVNYAAVGRYLMLQALDKYHVLYSGRIIRRIN